MRYFSILSALILSLLLVGCTPSSPAVPDFSYAESSFTATVRGAYVRTAEDGYTGDAALVGAPVTGERRAVAATVEVGAPNAEGARGMRVTFSEPAVLDGVTVTREVGSGAVTVTWPAPMEEGGQPMTFPAEGAEGLLRFAEALLPVGDIEKITPVAHGESTVECRSRDGDFTVIFRFLPVDQHSLPTYVAVTTPRERLELYVE